MPTMKFISLILFSIAFVLAACIWVDSNRPHASRCERFATAPVRCARALGQKVAAQVRPVLFVLPRWLRGDFGGQCDRLERYDVPEQWPTLMFMKSNGGL